MNLEVESISKEEVRENMQRMKNGKAVGPDDNTSGGMAMSRRECTEVLDEIVQQNDGKRENVRGVETQHANTNI